MKSIKKLLFSVLTAVVLTAVFSLGKNPPANSRVLAQSDNVCPGTTSSVLSDILGASGWHKDEDDPFEFTAPEGYIIDQVCIKGGSDRSPNGYLVNFQEDGWYYAGESEEECVGTSGIGTDSAEALHGGANGNICAEISHASFHLTEDEEDEEEETLSCESINVDPSLEAGNKFALGQTYNFSVNTTGFPIFYSWSINPLIPALSSSNDSTTSWTAPSVPNPGVTWTISLEISDEEENSDSCSIDLSDPTDQTQPTPTPTPMPTATPTSPSCASDEHLDLSGTKCLKYEYGGPSTGSSSGGTGGQVLGASTMAEPDLLKKIYT